MHGKVTFVADLSIKKFIQYAIVHFFALLLIIAITISATNLLEIDIRLVQPVAAVITQIVVVFVYKSIFWNRPNEKRLPNM